MQPLRDDDPETLGPFTLRGRLGAGGMGVVYLADTEEGVEVAVKTVPRGVGEDVRIRLQREAELLHKIDHPRIAKFVDADAEADEPWLAMRYISGPSLVDATLPLPPQQLRQLADGLAEALAALHKLGVTHRDVKPGNIIMTTHGAVLVDLGIAITAEAKSMTMVGTAVGSPAWMAPEQFAGDTAGPAADVWGWAAVLTYAATGKEPFGSGSIAALAHRIMTQQPALQGVPDWLRGAVVAAFAKRPEQRPSAEDLTRGGRVRLATTGTQPVGPGGFPPGPRHPGTMPLGPGQRPPGAMGPMGPGQRPPLQRGPQLGGPGGPNGPGGAVRPGGPAGPGGPARPPGPGVPVGPGAPRGLGGPGGPNGPGGPGPNRPAGPSGPGGPTGPGGPQRGGPSGPQRVPSGPQQRVAPPLHPSGPHPMPPRGNQGAGPTTGAQQNSGPARLPDVRPAHPSGPVPTTPARRSSGSHSAATSGSRRNWVMGGLGVVVVAAIVLAIVLLAGGGGGSNKGGSTSPTGPQSNSSSTVAGTKITTALLKQDGLCTGSSSCTITGQVPFTHPKWGKVTLVTVQGTADGSKLAQAELAVIDSSGTDQYHLNVGPVQTFAPVPDPTDNTGHIFMKYNSGRYDGIMVVGITTDTLGMTDFSSTPDSSGAGRFYDASLKLVSGRYQIILETNDCNPDCASGKITHSTVIWNGLQYQTS